MQAIRSFLPEQDRLKTMATEYVQKSCQLHRITLIATGARLALPVVGSVACVATDLLFGQTSWLGSGARTAVWTASFLGTFLTCYPTAIPIARSFQNAYYLTTALIGWPSPHHVGALCENAQKLSTHLTPLAATYTVMHITSHLTGYTYAWPLNPLPFDIFTTDFLAAVCWLPIAANKLLPYALGYNSPIAAAAPARTAMPAAQDSFVSFVQQSLQHAGQQGLLTDSSPMNQAVLTVVLYALKAYPANDLCAELGIDESQIELCRQAKTAAADATQWKSWIDGTRNLPDAIQQTVSQISPDYLQQLIAPGAIL